MAFQGIQKVVIQGEEFTSLSKACNRYDISYRELQKYAAKHGYENHTEALEQYATERKQMNNLLMFSPLRQG